MIPPLPRAVLNSMCAALSWLVLALGSFPFFLFVFDLFIESVKIKIEIWGACLSAGWWRNWGGGGKRRVTTQDSTKDYTLAGKELTRSEST